MSNGVATGIATTAKPLPTKTLVLKEEYERVLDLQTRISTVSERLNALSDQLHGSTPEEYLAEVKGVSNCLVQALADLTRLITRLEDATSRLEG